MEIKYTWNTCPGMTYKERVLHLLIQGPILMIHRGLLTGIIHELRSIAAMRREPGN